MVAYVQNPKVRDAGRTVVSVSGESLGTRCEISSTEQAHCHRMKTVDRRMPETVAERRAMVAVDFSPRWKRRGETSRSDD